MAIIAERLQAKRSNYFARCYHVVQHPLASRKSTLLNLCCIRRVTRHRTRCNTIQTAIPSHRSSLSSGLGRCVILETAEYTLLMCSKLEAPPATSVVNETTINLMYQLLSRDPIDYVNIAERVNDDSDVEILLDFMLLLLRERHLSNTADETDINLRARRLMLKVTTRTPVIPWSLIVTGVSIQSDRGLIGSGGFGRVFKGELGEASVALKVLYKTHNNIVSCYVGSCIMVCRCWFNKDFRREALMWRSLNHDHVLPFLGIYEDDSASYLVSPYMKNGTLAQWRKTQNPSIAEIEQRV